MNKPAELFPAMPYETGLTLADYEIIVDVENPEATNRDKAKEEGEQLRQLLGDHFEIRHVLNLTRTSWKRPYSLKKQWVTKQINALCS